MSNDLHGQIMNIRCNTAAELRGLAETREEYRLVDPESYALGHRDARHAAAEIVSNVEELEQKLAIAHAQVFTREKFVEWFKSVNKE